MIAFVPGRLNHCKEIASRLALECYLEDESLLIHTTNRDLALEIPSEQRKMEITGEVRPYIIEHSRNSIFLLDEENLLLGAGFASKRQIQWEGLFQNWRRLNAHFIFIVYFRNGVYPSLARYETHRLRGGFCTEKIVNFNVQIPSDLANIQTWRTACCSSHPL